MVRSNPITPEVSEEDVGESERHPITHHLTLCAFATIDEKSLALANDCDGCDVTFYGGA
jgi:hypothetical protein